jgi:hypothetical protein
VRESADGVTMLAMSHSSSRHRRSALLRDLERSGLSVAEFCRRKGIAYSTVAAWRAAERRLVTPRFVEIETVPPTAAAAALPERHMPDLRHPEALCAELTLPGGAVLRVYASTGAGGAS